MRNYFILVLLLLHVTVGISVAENLLTDTTKLPDGLPCSGWNPETNSYNRVGSLACHVPRGNCPEGYAYTSVWASTGNRHEAGVTNVQGHCCKLPDGILTTEHIFTLDTCPENYVATGAKTSDDYKMRPDEFYPECEARWELAEQYIRCTKINTHRFKLSIETSGVNVGWTKHFSFMFTPSTTRARIPLSFRYSVGRSGPTSWFPSSCIGLPFGSLLTSKSSKYCHGFGFRQILYRGIPGDPPEDTPVELFPKCERLTSPLSPFPLCEY